MGGLPNQMDLEALGDALGRTFSPAGLDGFEDLLAQLDACEAIPETPRDAGTS